MFKASVNTKTILRNIKTLKQHLNPGVKFCAVLKANAYGFGDIKMAKVINRAADMFAVTTVTEGIRLRNTIHDKPILVLGVCSDPVLAAKHNITITIGSVSEMKTLAQKATAKTNVHIKVNTGLNRFGITTHWQLKQLLSLTSTNPQIAITGLYTHMSHESGDTAEIEKQVKKFTPFRSMIKRNFPSAIIHAACSGSCEYKSAQFDMVRIGKAMYGGFTGYKTCLTLTSNIVAVQNVPKGSGIGYGHNFIADKPTTVGVVSCGYADFGFLNFSSMTNIRLGRTYVKVLSVSMDTIMIDITDVANPLGKTITLISSEKGTTFTDFVNQSGKSACLMFCSMNYERGKLVYQ